MMKKYFQIIFSFLMVFYLPNLGYAQLATDAHIYDKIQNALSELDKSAITSQTFFDQSMGFIDWNELNGEITTTSEILKGKDYAWLRIQLESSFINNYNPLPAEETYMGYLASDYDNSTIPLSIFNWDYQKFTEDPEGENLITIDHVTEKLYDVEDRPTSPYIDSRLVAFCPVIERELLGLTQSFTLYSDLILTNQTMATSIRVDFDNGEGFTSIFSEVEKIINYNDAGTKILTLEYTMPNGEILFAQSSIEIVIPSNTSNLLKAIMECGPGYTLENKLADENRTDIVPGVMVNIAYNCLDENGDGKMLKPFIIIEGFDPPTLGNFNQYHTIQARLDLLSPNPAFNSTNGNPVILPSGKSLQEELYCEGYDLIYIDFVNFGADDIFANSDRVQQIIEWVNNRKEEDGSEEENVLLGTSMGGVIGYRVLQQMEQAGIPAECKYLITFDSPLRGANIPIGLQQLATVFANTKVTSSKTIGDKAPMLVSVKGALSSPAAKQLMVRNVFHSYNQNGQNESNLFYANLHSLPAPSTAEILHISSGSGVGEQQILGPGGQYLKFRLGCENNWGSFMLDYVEIYFESNTIDFPVYKQAYEKRLLGLFLIEFQSIEVNSSIPYEYSSSPGGSSDFGVKHFFTNPSPIDDCDPMDIVNFPTKGNFCFVPTFSALNVAGEIDPMTFVASGCTSPAVGCSWATDDSVWSHISEVKEHNQYHVSLNTRTANFILSHLKSGSNGSDINPLDDKLYNFGDSDEVPSGDPSELGYYQTDNIIDYNLAVLNEGQLLVNRNKRVDFVADTNNKKNSVAAHFDLYVQPNTCDGSDIVVSIQSNSKFLAGQWDTNTNNTADVYIKPQATVEVQNRSEFKIDQYSNLYIDGGTVIVKSGGLLQTGWNGKIYVRNGGHLIIEAGGALRIRDNAQLIVEDEGKFTFMKRSKLQLWNGKVAADNPNRCNIKIKRDGIFNYGGQPVITGLGYIQFDKYNEVTVEGNVTEFKFKGKGKDEMLFQLNAGASVDLPEVGLRLHDMRIEYYAGSALTVDGDQKIWVVETHFLGISNSNNFGLVGAKNNRVYMINSKFENLDVGFLTFDIEPGTIHDVFNSEFLNNKTSVWSINDRTLRFNNCEFNSGDVGLKLEGTGTASFNNNCLITGYRGENSQNYLTAEGGIVALISKERATSIRLDNSKVVGNDIGIFSPMNHKCSVGLFNDARVDYNRYGISMPAPIDKPDGEGTNSGVVTVDCSSISYNHTAGVYGSKIHLIIDASQPWIGSNTFERLETGVGLLFDMWNTDSSYCALGISAHDNYWGPKDYCPSYPKDFRIRGSDLCWINLTTDCPEEITCESGEPLPPCDDDRVEGRSCPCTIPATFPVFQNMNQQWNAAMKAYKGDDIERMETYLSPIGSISNADRDQYDNCRQLIDQARGLAPFNISDDQTNLEDKEAEVVARSVNEKATAMVYPNPFEETLNITLEGKHIVKVFSLDGRLIYDKSSEDRLIISTKDWSIGTYVIKILNVATQVTSEEKVVKV